MNHFEKLRKTMVDTQVRPSGVSRTEVIDALASVPRELFLPEYLKNLSYIEENIVFESGRFIVQPRILGKLLAKPIKTKINAKLYASLFIQLSCIESDI